LAKCGRIERTPLSAIRRIPRRISRDAFIIPHVTNLEDSAGRERALGDFTAQHGKRLRGLALDLIVSNAGCGLAGIPHL
jgi:hypothetical protein